MDEWFAGAVRAGVSRELAALGREVIRDYYQHGKDLEDVNRQWLGSSGSYMLQLALQAPNTAFLDFSASLVWAGASELDGDVEAFSMLIERLGAQDAVDNALAREDAAAQRLKLEYAHA